MARPKKATENLRKKTMRIRVTADEESQILRNAKMAGFRTASDFFRHFGIGNKAKRNSISIENMDELLRLKGEVGKIGSNVNQIARAINQDRIRGYPIAVPDRIIEAAMLSVDEAMKQLLGLLGYGD